MAPRIAPPSRNAAAQALLELYQSTERRIIREIARKRTQGYVDYAELAALRRVRRAIQQMVDGSAKYVPLAIEHEFYKGKEAKKGYENALSVAGSPERDRVMEQLVDNLMGEVQEMAQTAYQSAEAQIYLTGRTDPGVYRQSVLRGAIASQAEGRGSLSTVEQVMQSLQQAGITAFVDRSGREWSLSAYGSMAVRTTVRQAQVSAVLTADDHDLWKIKEIGSTCPLCAVYEGRVYSKSGMNPNYPPLAAAFGKMDPAGPNDLSNTFLNIHPNCLHSLVKWTEDYKTDEEIRQAREFSSFETNPKTNDPRTEKQIEAYRNKERQRAAYRRNLDQFDRYTKAGVEGFPKSMATFLKHKQADDDKYKAWMAEYRKAEKPKTEKSNVEKPAVQYKRFESGEAAAEYFGQRPPRSLRREDREEYDRRRAEYESSVYGTWSSGLTVDEQASIGNYSGDAYSGINGLLRKQMTEKMVDAWDANERLGVRDMINNLDSAIGRFELKDPIRVYRTCEKDVLESLKAQPGATFRDNGYVSTSALSKKVASGNVVMEIDVPPGVGHGAWINPLSGAEDEEYEFLMPRGSEFKVKGVSERDGDTVIHMEFIGSQKQPIEFATREEVIDRWKRLGIYDEDNAKKI